jgi:TPR repeat protein
VPQSDALALKWWRSAAEQGDAQAQSKLGLFYAQGSKGVGPPLDAEAVKWWHKAAAQGHANAQFNLGLMIAQVCLSILPVCMHIGKHAQVDVLLTL